MKQSTINSIRNSVHIIGGFCLSYWALSHLSNNDFYLWQLIIMYFILGSFFALAAGFIWEGLMNMLLKEPSDLKDVMRTGLGGLLGSALCFFKQDIQIISYMLLTCIVLAIVDIIRANKNKK